MKPKGAPMTQSASSAPTMPKGMAANTSSGLIAFLNCTTSARKISATEMTITSASSPKPSSCFSCSPPISSV